MCRDHEYATEIYAFEAILTRLVLENSDFIGGRELGKSFFVSDPDLPVSNISDSLKASLFSDNLKPTTNQKLNEFHCYETKN